ncbi:MAG: hypothetical protein V1725_01655 [archaeon]
MEPDKVLFKAYITEHLDIIVDVELFRLKTAVENYRGNPFEGLAVRDTLLGEAETLVKLGLLKPAGKDENLRHTDYIFTPTGAGLQLYDLIYKKNG